LLLNWLDLDHHGTTALPAESRAWSQCSGTAPFKDASSHVISPQGAPPPGELAQAQFVIGVLLGRRDPQLLDAYLQTLDAGLLADVVIANMARLPSTAPPDDGGSSGAGGLTGLMQVSINVATEVGQSDQTVRKGCRFTSGLLLLPCQLAQVVYTSTFETAEYG
jgi:hypothetical protein